MDHQFYAPAAVLPPLGRRSGHRPRRGPATRALAGIRAATDEDWLCREGRRRSAVEVLEDVGREDAGPGLDDLDPEDPGRHVVVDALGLERTGARAHLGNGAEVHHVALHGSTVEPARELHFEQRLLVREPTTAAVV